jgi:GMP synthase PP-ATPase subunit
MTGRLISEETRRKMSESHKGKGVRPVVMFDSSGVFIEEFKTVTDACEKLKFRKEDVYRCLSRKSRNYKNLIFKYKEDLL